MFHCVTCLPYLQNGTASRSRPGIPLASEPVGFGQKYDATVDIPLDNMNVMNLCLTLIYFNLMKVHISFSRWAFVLICVLCSMNVTGS